MTVRVDTPPLYIVQWFSVTMCFYGLGFASTSLSGSPHTNFLLSAIVEIPSCVFCFLVMDCWGRRPILLFCQVSILDLHISIK